jgi:hypothetical protein
MPSRSLVAFALVSQLNGLLRVLRVKQLPVACTILFNGIIQTLSLCGSADRGHETFAKA